MQNLWAEYDHEQELSAARGRARSRRLSEQTILADLRSWLLQEYLASFCRALTANPLYRRCYWIDALGANGKALPDAAQTENAAPESGNGKKRRRQAQEQPLPAILQPLGALNQALARESRALTLYGIALEAGSSRRNDTRAPRQPDVSIPKEGGLVRASWLEVATGLLQMLDQSPAVFLLNPFGPTLFTYEDLDLLFQRTPPTELCLLVPHRQVETRLLAARRSTAAASALMALLRSDRWKALLPQEQGTELPAQAVDGLIDLLLALIRRQFLAAQPIAVPVQVRPALIESAPYTLIFATRRQDSLLSMNEAVCLHRRRLDAQSHQDVLGAEWFAAQQRERIAAGKAQLYEQALQIGRARQVRRWPDLRQQLLCAQFGRFTLHEYDEVIHRLLQEGEVYCQWRRRTLQDEEDARARVPGNDDTLIWKR